MEPAGNRPTGGTVTRRQPRVMDRRPPSPAATVTGGTTAGMTGGTVNAGPPLGE